MEHWNRLKKTEGPEQGIICFKNSLSQLSSSTHPDTFKFITAAVKKYPELLEEASKWIQAQPSFDYRGLAAFLAHLPSQLRPSPCIPALWRIFFGGCPDESLLFDVVGVYLNDLSTDWILSFCLREGFFYSDGVQLRRLEILNELFKRRPKHPELPGCGLVEKVAQLWPILENFGSEMVLKVLIKVSAFIEPRPLFSVDELIAIISIANSESTKKLSRLLQFEVQKLPNQVYVLSSSRDRYSKLGAALIDYLLSLPSPEEGLLRAVLDRWSVLQCQQRELEMFLLIEGALHEHAFKDSTLVSLLHLQAPQLYKSLLGHLLRNEKVTMLPPLSKLMKESPAAGREIQELFTEEAQLKRHLQACISASIELEWLKNLIGCSLIGMFVEWEMPAHAQLLAEHLRRGNPAPRLSNFVFPIEAAAGLSSADLKVLIESFDITDTRLRLICGIEPGSGSKLSAEEMLLVATLIKDQQSASLAISHMDSALDSADSLWCLLILQYKAGMKSYNHPVTSSSIRPFNTFLETIYPGLIDTTPSSDALLNLKFAFMYGDSRTLRALQTEILSKYAMIEVAKEVPIGVLLGMEEFGRIVLEGAWQEICFDFTVAVGIDSLLKSFYFEVIK